MVFSKSSRETSPNPASAMILLRSSGVGVAWSLDRSSSSFSNASLSSLARWDKWSSLTTARIWIDRALRCDVDRCRSASVASPLAYDSRSESDLQDPDPVQTACC